MDDFLSLTINGAFDNIKNWLEDFESDGDKYYGTIDKKNDPITFVDGLLLHDSNQFMIVLGHPYLHSQTNHVMVRVGVGSLTNNPTGICQVKEIPILEINPINPNETSIKININPLENTPNLYPYLKLLLRAISQNWRETWVDIHNYLDSCVELPSRIAFDLLISAQPNSFFDWLIDEIGIIGSVNFALNCEHEEINLLLSGDQTHPDDINHFWDIFITAIDVNQQHLSGDLSLAQIRLYDLGENHLSIRGYYIYEHPSTIAIMTNIESKIRRVLREINDKIRESKRPSEETRKRADACIKVKTKHPEYTKSMVGLEVETYLGETLSEDQVKYALNEVGYKWKQER